MSLQSILASVFSRFTYFSKEKLLLILKELISNYKRLDGKHEALDRKYEALKHEKKTLEVKIKEFETKEAKAKIFSVNKSYSKPSSKQPEWEDKGVGNDGRGKKKGRGRKKREGSGNKSKNRTITYKETTKVDNCAFCGKDLSD